MSFTPYSPSDQWHGQLNVPDNGEADTSANLFDATAKYNADSALYLYNRSVEAKGGEISIPLVGVDFTGLDGETKDWLLKFQQPTPTGALYWEQQSPVVDDDDGHLLIPIPSWPYVKYSRIYVNWKGAAHGGSWPPTNRPQVALLNVQNDGTLGSSTPTVDSSDQTTYETAHELEVTPGEALFLDDRSWWIQIRGESGTNAVPGLRLYSVILKLIANT